MTRPQPGGGTDATIGIAGAQLVLGHQQHAAGAAGGSSRVLAMPGLVTVGVLDEKDHHEPDDLAR